MSRLISPEGLVRVKEHKYICHAQSPLERWTSKYIWEQVIKFVPMDIAPNTITLIGFIAMAMSYIPMMFYDISLTKEVPSWLFFSSAFLQFFGQIADGIDGKQARRTKSSSPLGHMFDHTCDAFSASFYLLSIMQAFQLGEHHLTVLLFFVCGLLVFWTFMWNQAHTKILLQHFSGVGVCEAQTIMNVLLLLTGILGQQFWSKPMADFIPSLLTNVLPAHSIVETVLNTPFKLAFLYAIMCVLVMFSVTLLIETTSESKSRVIILKENIPFVHLIILIGIWFQTPFYDNYRAPVFLILGTHFALITARMIINGVTEDPFPTLHRELVALTGLTPFLLKDVLFPEIKLPFPEQKAFLIFVSCFTLIAVFTWSARVINEISEHLGIKVFSIKKPEQWGAEIDAKKLK